MHPFLFRPEHVEKLAHIRGALGHLRELAATVGEGDGFDRTLEELIDHLDELFLVVVVGEMKAGKSTLINALLGREVCAVGPTPLTDRITIIRYGETSMPEGDRGGVREHSLPVPELEGLAIVDTPGTNSLIRWHQELTEGFLPRADIVLFATSCDRPYTASENSFLKLIRGRWRRKIVFVLTKTDIKEPDEIDEIVAYVRKSALEELGLEPEILLLSPREAYRARLDGDEERLERSGFGELRRLVLETLNDEEKAHLRLIGPVDAGLALANEVHQSIRRTREILERDFRQLRELEESTARSYGQLRDEVRSARDRLNEVFAALRLRGETFVTSLLHPRRIATALSRSRAERRFREEVVGDLEKRLVGVMDGALAQLVELARRWFRDTIEAFTQMVETGPHRDRVSARPAPRFEAEREEVLKALRDRATAHVKGFDPAGQGREILAATARGAGFAVAGVGAGVLSAALLGTLVGPGWAMLALPLAGAGLIFPLWRRRRLRRAWGQQVMVLEGRCRESLEEALQGVLNEAAERVREIDQPYRAFHESEVRRVDEMDDELARVMDELRTLRGESGPEEVGSIGHLSQDDPGLS